MNQEKIGKFIAQLRKNKNMTQQDLAEKMGISINAVSKWERGISFPDVSLYKKLCKELGISIEELINGEKDNSDEAKEKALITTIKEKNRIKKVFNKKIMFIIITFISIIIGIIIYNKSYKLNLVNDSNELYDIAINYFREQEFIRNPDAIKKDFNVFYSYHGFGISEKDNYKYVYMWIYNQSYYLEEENSLAISSSMSIPYKITFKDKEIINIEYPKDGNQYKESIQKIFPDVIATQVLSFDRAENLNKLFNEAASKKNKYYNYLNLDMSKITIDDISYNDLIFIINMGSKICIPVQLSIYKNNKYILSIAYRACKKNQICNSMLNYTRAVEGKYNYDIIEIIKHSTDANNMQFNMDNLPEYEITTGNGYQFITDHDNKYLNEFLKIINVDLNICATPDYN